MSFRTYFLGLPADDRASYADRAGSTVGYLMQIAYGNKLVDLGFADVLVAVSDGALSLEDIPLSERAVSQHGIRSMPERRQPA